MTTTENEQRDELARDIFITDNARNQDPAALWDEADQEHMHYAEVIADGLIAAGYRKPTVLGYAVVGRNGRTFGVLYSTSREAQISADEWTADCLESGIGWDYRVAEIVEAAQ